MLRTRSMPAWLFTAWLLATASAPAAAQTAGPASDALGKCLVDSSTAAEKTTLVRWMFGMLSLHPDLAQVSSISGEQREAISKAMATAVQREAISKAMATAVQRLLTEACATQARDVIRNEGLAAFERSFAVLGQAAARNLFGDPKVQAGLGEMTKYLDQKKLSELAKPEP